MALLGFETTVWPLTRISDEAKSLLSRFLSLLDLKDPEAGKLMVKEIFAPDATLVASNGTFKGAEGTLFQETPSLVASNRLPHSVLMCTELAVCRKTAWDVIAFRQHKVERAYLGDVEGKEIILTGKMDGILKNDLDTTMATEFAVRIVLEDDVGGRLKLKLWHAFPGDSYSTKKTK